MIRPLAAAAAVAAASTLAACGGEERTAEAEVNSTTVEVTTELPANAVTDQQLNAVAEGAAIAAGTPQGSATGVVVAPPSNTTTNTMGNATTP